MSSIGIKFPFSEASDGGIFKSTKTTQEAIKSDLIALLTLKRGQRPMHNALFSPLYDFIHESFDEILQDSLKAAVTDKINLFFPEIEVRDVISTFEENTHVLRVKVVYVVPALGNIQDSFSVAVVTENQ